MTGEAKLSIQDLKQHFKVRGKKDLLVKAVDGVSFTIPAGETLGLVGESGCGKSTLARTIIRMYEPTAGQIFIDNEEIGKLTEKQLKPYRKRIQMIFQDPYSSLNSRMTVREIIGEPLIANNIGRNQKERNELIESIIGKVGLDRSHLSRYPHEFSGGQRQRIGIARSLIVQPEIILCDEPISALDVSIQAQVVNMLEDFQREMGLTYLFIAHDLSMVRYVSHNVGVMYLGRIVEFCPGDEIYTHPLHPYTAALLSAAPAADPEAARRKNTLAIKGEVPSPVNPPPGCHFHSRCPYAMDKCQTEAPILADAGNGHQVACHLY